MKYRHEVHKYILEEDELYNTGIKGYDIDTQFIKLSPDGIMLLRKGYQSDGPSGPTVDTPWTIPAAFGHDAGYDLIQMGLLPMEYQHVFDGLFYQLLIRDGNIWADRKPTILRPILKKWVENRALLWYTGVYDFGKSSCNPKNIEQILEAP
jgi:hypothetical protein